MFVRTRKSTRIRKKKNKKLKGIAEPSYIFFFKK